MITNSAVMAGGQSRRFLRDKTLEVVNGRRLIEYPVSALAPVSENFAVIAKDCGKYEFLGVRCIPDAYEVQCPMAGILTALKAFQGRVFVVAADTPFVSPHHAEKLFKAADGHDAAVPIINGRHHPLYACYNTGIIPIFEKALSEGRYALMKCFEEADTVFCGEEMLLESEDERFSFTNINTETDLAEAMKVYKERL